MILILDLDDTLFPTKSIEPSVFAPAMRIIETYFQTRASDEQYKQVLHDLWSTPFDHVAQKHQIPQSIQQTFVHQLNTISYELDIALYPDYSQLKTLDCEKILVTTGFPKLQEAKIEALNIRTDFSAVYIDNPFAANRKHKLGIFQEIVASKNSSPSHFTVIGDNPVSEIQAGKSLGMYTIQRKKMDTPPSPLADYSIDSFAELEGVLHRIVA